MAQAFVCGHNPGTVRGIYLHEHLDHYHSLFDTGWDTWSVVFHDVGGTVVLV